MIDRDHLGRQIYVAALRRLGTAWRRRPMATAGAHLLLYFFAALPISEAWNLTLVHTSVVSYPSRLFPDMLLLGLGGGFEIALFAWPCVRLAGVVRELSNVEIPPQAR